MREWQSASFFSFFSQNKISRNKTNFLMSLSC